MHDHNDNNNINNNNHYVNGNNNNQNGGNVTPVNNDWSTSFDGIGLQPFPDRINQILMAPVADHDIEVKPGKLLLLFTLFDYTL